MRGWIIVGALFFVLWLIFGSAVTTQAVFIAALSKRFGWSVARVSALFSIMTVATAFSGPVAGRLLERVKAQSLIAVGAALTGASMLVAAWLSAGRSGNFAQLLCAYAALGVGVGLSTLVPAAVVVASWFSTGRALAMGVTIAGTTTGGMVMLPIAESAILRGGPALAYLMLAGPMFVIAIPLALALVRDRRYEPAGQVSRLAGLSVSSGLYDLAHTVRFWMNAIAQLCFGFLVGAMAAHLFSFLVMMGKSGRASALLASLSMGAAGLGKVVMGIVADRAGVKLALVTTFLVGAAGELLIVSRAYDEPVLIGSVVSVGLAMGAPLALLPVLLAESLGLERFAALSGIMTFVWYIGYAAAPLVVGGIFDLTGSYLTGFGIAGVACVLAAFAVSACSLPREAEPALLAPGV